MIAMSNTPSVSPVAPSRLEYPPSEAVVGRFRASGAESRPATVAGDLVEISEDAVNLQAQGRDIRTDLVSRIRSEIASGTYLTEDKIDRAISGLLDDLRG